MTPQDSKRKGFTLIEVIVVVAVITLLASVVFYSFGEARKKSRDAQRKSDLEQIQLALRLYKDAYGKYPDCPGGDALGDGVSNGGPDSCANPLPAPMVDVNNILRPYLPSIPKDPGAGLYVYDSDIKCEKDGGVQSHVILMTTEAETTNMKNWEGVCGTYFSGGQPSPYRNTLPNPGKPNRSGTYGIILK